jgi:hypothetical protein
MAEKNPVVLMTTSKGNIRIELDAEKAPITTKNFLDYVSEGHYDGLIFHRVIPGFMVQGGGMDAQMKEKRNKGPIKNEAANGLKNDAGTIAMARTNVVDSKEQRFPQSPQHVTGGVWLCRIRPSDRRHGCGAEHRKSKDRQPGVPSGRASGDCRHQFDKTRSLRKRIDGALLLGGPGSFWIVFSHCG